MLDLQKFLEYLILMENNESQVLPNKFTSVW